MKPPVLPMLSPRYSVDLSSLSPMVCALVINGLCEMYVLRLHALNGAASICVF
jgi:hypothetical protein